MKQLVLFLLFLISSTIVKAQVPLPPENPNHIAGSIQKGELPNSVDILYKANYNSPVGEYPFYLSISIAVPAASAIGLTPSIKLSGPFADMSSIEVSPSSYTDGDETIYSWVFDGHNTLKVPWINSVPFIGATIVFMGGNGAAKVRLVNFEGGGANSSTYFSVYTNNHFANDFYPYTFYSSTDVNGGTAGLDSQGQYVETNQEVDLGTCNHTVNAGAISGKEVLCLGETITYSSDGDAGGVWSSSNKEVIIIDPITGVATSVGTGAAYITYFVSGCSSAQANKLLTVESPVNPSIIIGDSIVCEQAHTYYYIDRYDENGIWSSSNSAVATVDPNGWITGVSGGVADIIFTVGSSCGPVSSYKTIKVNPIINPGTISGSSALNIGDTLTYTSNGAPGGVWDVTETGIVTVNAGSGLVTAIQKGSTTIKYTTNNICGGAQSAYKAVYVNDPAIPRRIQASLEQGSIDINNTVYVKFLPSYTNGSDEYVNNLNISIAIPTGSANGVTPTITTMGPFKNMVLKPATPFSYTAGSETIYSWVYESGPQSMSWVADFRFIGATISFSGNTNSTKVRLVDFSNSVPAGGDNGKTLFRISTNREPFDLINYTEKFYADPFFTDGTVLGTYSNGNQYVETKFLVRTQACNTMNIGALVNISGPSKLIVGDTATFITNIPGGMWKSSNSFIAKIDSSKGLVTADNPGYTTITYTLEAGCPFSPTRSLLLPCLLPPSPYIKGSIGTGPSAFIEFYPGYTNEKNEYVKKMNISIAIQKDSAIGVVPHLEMAWSGPFSGMTVTPASPFSYIEGDEMIFSWICTSDSTTMTWMGGFPFIGAYVVFEGGETTISKVRLIDFSKHVPAGGANNTLFSIFTNKDVLDKTDPGDKFYNINNNDFRGGSTKGNYPNGDQYVQTNYPVRLEDCSSHIGIISGPGSFFSPLLVGQAGVFTESGNTGGEWLISDSSIATINPKTGVVMGISPGMAQILYAKYTKCSSLPTYFTTTIWVGINTCTGVMVSFSDTVCNSYILPWGDTVRSSGTYYHIYRMASGCDSVVTAYITINNNLLLTTKPLVLACGSGSINLNTGITSSANGLTVSFYSNAALTKSISPIVSKSGTYYVKVTNGFCSANGNIVVTTVKDKEKPTLACPGSINAGVTSRCSQRITVPNPVYNDNCGVTKLVWIMLGATKGASSLKGINLIGAKNFNIGLTRVTYIATDAAGNVSTGRFNVVINDNIRPSISCPANIIESASGKCNKKITIRNPVFSDNCIISRLTWTMAGATNLRSSSKGINYVGTRTFNSGTTNITYTVRDLAGNTSNCSFTVKVNGSTNCKTVSQSQSTVVEFINDKMEVDAFPNPSNTLFNLRVRSAIQSEVLISISDITGKVLQQVKGVPGQSFQFGERFIPGTYMVEVRQGSDRIIRKLIKY